MCLCSSACVFDLNSESRKHVLISLKENINNPYEITLIKMVLFIYVLLDT